VTRPTDDSDAVALMRAAGRPADDELPKPILALVLIAAAVTGSITGWIAAGIMDRARQPTRSS
jgi:hypothetical protein